MQGSAEKNAWAVIDRFLEAFTKADQEAVFRTFWPDAPFWGTTSQTLVTTPEGIRSYFKNLAQWRPGQRIATWDGGWSAGISDTSALISGPWQIATLPEGAAPIRLLRMSAVVTKRDDEWRIAQFHNSVRPDP